MNKYKISIPKPCEEDWNKMSPSINGRYCSSCEKTVIDFTNKKKEEIKSIIDHSIGEVCGRFNTSDVYIPIIKDKVSLQKRSWFQSKWLAMSAIISLIGFGKKAHAQTVGQFVKPVDTPTKSAAPKKTSTVIHGWIKSVDHEKGIAQIEIRVYSGGKEIAYTRNFANGSYFITIPENTIWDFKVDIEYSSVKYQTQILRDLPIQKDRVKCDVNLSLISQSISFTTMGGIDGGYEYGTIIENPQPYTVGKITHEYLEPIIEENEVMYTYNQDSSQVSDKNNLEESVVPEKNFTVVAYPNPGIGLFNFSIENSEKSEIFIFDIEGKLIESRKTTATNEQVDLTKHPNGTYVVRVVSISLNKVKQLKVIKIG